MTYKNHTYPDGTEYVGDWKENQRHGYGVWTRPDGMRYDGEWQYDKPHGQGVLTYPDGRKRIGIWEVGKFLSYINEASNEVIDNTMAENKTDNKIYVYKNKSKYIGEWKDKKSMAMVYGFALTG